MVLWFIFSRLVKKVLNEWNLMCVMYKDLSIGVSAAFVL